MKDIIEKLQNLTIIAKKEISYTGNDCVQEEDIRKFVEDHLEEDYSDIETAFLDSYYPSYELEDTINDMEIEIQIIR